VRAFLNMCIYRKPWLLKAFKRGEPREPKPRRILSKTSVGAYSMLSFSRGKTHSSTPGRCLTIYPLISTTHLTGQFPVITNAVFLRTSSLQFRNYLLFVAIALVACIIFSTLALIASSPLPLLIEVTMYFATCSAFLSVITSIY
jgi:hypothetical protein